MRNNVKTEEINKKRVSCTKSTGHAGVRINDDFDKGDYEKCINLWYKSWRWLW